MSALRTTFLTVHNIFLIAMILEHVFEYYTRKLNILLQFQQANCVHYMLHH